MESLIKLFNNPQLLAEQAARINLQLSLDIIRSTKITSQDSSEQGAYFCAVPKSCFSSPGDAFPLLLIHNLYDSQEWDKTQPPFKDFNIPEWNKYLTSHWLPEYLALGTTKQVAYKSVNETEFYSDWFTIANGIAVSALRSPIRNIIRYGMIDAWNFYDYILETDDEYIDFQYWTTA